MRPGLVWLIVIGAGIATAATEVIVFRIVSPPDVVPTLLGGLWVAMPYIATVALAFLARRHTAVLLTLLVALLVSTSFGLPMLGNMAVNQAAADEQVRTAVQPGEDPKSGPASHRRVGAELGKDITDLFSVVLAVVLPPIQLAVIVVPTLIAWVVVALYRRKEEVGQPST